MPIAVRPVWLSTSLLLVLVACAPPTAMPPPVPMGTGLQYGGAAVLSGSLSPRWTEGPDGSLDLLLSPEPGADLHAWGMVDIEGTRCQAGGTAFGGMTTVFGAGAFARCDLFPGDRVVIGAQGELGVLWAGVGIPLAWQATPTLNLYSTPTFRPLFAEPWLVPLGANVKLGKGPASLNVEAGARFSLLGELGYYDVDIGYVAVGVALARPEPQSDQAR